ncbi:MAG: hypothetical protein NT077_01205 [Candidatus Taylorbacteria bacterium]|nr:hypothetical protein [Candidatus Taylorbacteria bacterium]
MKKTSRYKFPYSDIELAGKVNSILSEYRDPLTLRQVYYRLVALGLKNEKKVYSNLSGKLSRLRAQGLVPWEKITDMKRLPEKDSSWTSPEEFFKDVSGAYKRDLQQGQPKYIEVWCEKSVAIRRITNKYDVNLLAGGGYRSSTAIYEAAKRFKSVGKPVVILYLGDFDPSGLDIERDIGRVNKLFDIEVDVQRVLLVPSDIRDYKLLPSPVKITDPRTAAYIKEQGLENAYELDALAPDILATRLENAICRNMNMDLYKTQLAKWEEDKEEVAEFIEAWNGHKSSANPNNNY